MGDYGKGDPKSVPGFGKTYHSFLQKLYGKSFAPLPLPLPKLPKFPSIEGTRKENGDFLKGIFKI